jgi:predicted TIM-barrel fold metal-dependent hydrolase
MTEMKMPESTQAPVRRYELPEAIAPFAGLINDTDGHEAMPIKRWEDTYGAEIRPLAAALLKAGDEGEAIIQHPDLDGDETEITVESVWQVKMEKAPGCYDIGRRIEVMDFTGIHRQIMYPGIAPIYAHALYNKADDPKVFRSITGDRKAYAYRLMDIYNDWCARISREQDRVRPTALLIDETPEAMYEKAKKLVDKGVRLFMLTTDEPPGGVSPASPRLDPLWSLLAAAKCPVLGHISISEKLLSTLEWRNAPAFQGWMLGAEFSLDPWTLTNIHLQMQNYVMTMVLGGVFDRHPDLVLGCAEFTGHWVGPLAENMDRFYGRTPFPSSQSHSKLKLKPSEYVRRNLRVACFDFEPVGTYIDRYGFEDVFCYASDFPHHEGGKDPMGSFVRNLAGKSSEVLRKVFVENGRALLPD